MKTSSLILSLFFVSITNAQTTFQKSFNLFSYDNGTSIEQTSDGGFILSGWIDSLGSSNSNVYVVKTNVNGVLEWSKTYDIANNDRGICIRETSDAGFIICGVNWPVGFSL